MTLPRRTPALQGTLDLLVLRTLSLGPRHGFGIAEHIERASRALVRVEEGSLYPALHRLEQAGLLASEWRESEHRRRARFYRLTARGRRQLAVEEERWERLARGVQNVLEFA